MQDAPAQDAPAEDVQMQDAPAQDAPAQDAPAQDAPAQDADPDFRVSLELMRELVPLGADGIKSWVQSKLGAQAPALPDFLPDRVLGIWQDRLKIADNAAEIKKLQEANRELSTKHNQDVSDFRSAVERPPSLENKMEEVLEAERNAAPENIDAEVAKVVDRFKSNLIDDTMMAFMSAEFKAMAEFKISAEGMAQAKEELTAKYQAALQKAKDELEQLRQELSVHLPLVEMAEFVPLAPGFVTKAKKVSAKPKSSAPKRPREAAPVPAFLTKEQVDAVYAAHPNGADFASLDAAFLKKYGVTSLEEFNKANTSLGVAYPEDHICKCKKVCEKAAPGEKKHGPSYQVNMDVSVPTKEGVMSLVSSTYSNRTVEAGPPAFGSKAKLEEVMRAAYGLEETASVEGLRLAVLSAPVYITDAEGEEVYNPNHNRLLCVPMEMYEDSRWSIPDSSVFAGFKLNVVLEAKERLNKKQCIALFGRMGYSSDDLDRCIYIPDSNSSKRSLKAIVYGICCSGLSDADKALASKALSELPVEALMKLRTNGIKFDSLDAVKEWCDDEEISDESDAEEGPDAKKAKLN